MSNFFRYFSLHFLGQIKTKSRAIKLRNVWDIRHFWAWAQFTISLRSFVSLKGKYMRVLRVFLRKTSENALDSKWDTAEILKRFYLWIPLHLWLFYSVKHWYYTMSVFNSILRWCFVSDRRVLRVFPALDVRWETPFCLMDRIQQKTRSTSPGSSGERFTFLLLISTLFKLYNFTEITLFSKNALN